jgi:hypothetical protein
MTIASAGVVGLAAVESLWAFTPLFAVCGVELGLGWALTNVATQGVVRPEVAGAAEGITLTALVMLGTIGSRLRRRSSRSSAARQAGPPRTGTQSEPFSSARPCSTSPARPLSSRSAGHVLGRKRSQPSPSSPDISGPVASKQAMGRAAALLVVLAVGAAGCGGGSLSRAKEEGPFGKAADQYWLFLPAGKPKAVVLFLHGLDESELRPGNHLGWLRHLSAEGDAVVYPRYEVEPGLYGAIRHTMVATASALRRLGSPAVPLILIGYSRGARLAVESAAVLPALGRPPAVVLSVFPNRLIPSEEEVINLGSIAPTTHVVLLAGDRDTDVGSGGVWELVRRLEAGGFPARNIEARLIRSRKDLVADHFAPLRSSPAARVEFWARADRLIASAQKPPS